MIRCPKCSYNNMRRRLYDDVWICINKKCNTVFSCVYDNKLGHFTTGIELGKYEDFTLEKILHLDR